VQPHDATFLWHVPPVSAILQVSVRNCVEFEDSSQRLRVHEWGHWEAPFRGGIPNRP